jgi:hypothetical protein
VIFLFSVECCLVLLQWYTFLLIQG